jgi:1-acyl-sn-glycerol-3-phosphate acyltransferase
MQQIVFDTPYTFVPPRYNAFLAGMLRLFWLPGHLRKTYGITSCEIIGAEKMRASFEAGHGVLAAANHCRPCDPMVLGHFLGREMNRAFHTMASAHLFRQGKVQAYLLPRMGGFSVYREGLDRESLNCAVRLLSEARHPLLVFPEGFVTRSNDMIRNLMDGISFMTRLAAKQRATTGGKVVVHPVFIRYFFQGDLERAIKPVIDGIENRLSWQPQSHLPLRERVMKAGLALLSLKEIEHIGAAGSGPPKQRLAVLLDHLLVPLEAQWLGGRRDPDPMERIKKLRTAILQGMIGTDIPESERESRWRQLANLYLAQQLHCYPGDYIEGTELSERWLETVERYEEDLTDTARPHAPMHAVICVGDAIEACATRDRGAEADPLMKAVRDQFETMLEQSKSLRPMEAGA